ncbi:tetratricopeptide repeat protein [Neolewinella xylanilytica]|uniref:Tetratricopeptide repeat protein n=1 Tax=Neolewinella xylanilytica TaxID=1514080 RepID=A0A2S6I6B0_9BACT|nr:tetratricopeptide repeat protein [Neolewinella xylanilytica]PPK86704.1 tetratricopeptide repeat protein [Neolewinella xylanilytica]
MSSFHTLPALLLLLCTLFTACGGEPAADRPDSGAPTIPELLPRPEALQAAAEWDNTQSGYSKMAAQLRLENPDAIEPRITLAKIFINEARVTGEHGHYYPAALQLLDDALALNHAGPRNPNLEFDAMAARASVLLSQHAFAEALATAKEAASINPHNAQVYGAIVDAYVELGHYPEAIAAADKMNEIRPDLRAYSRVSYLREIHGDTDGAIEAMERAVRAGAPGYESTAWARLTLGGLYERYGQPEKAAKEYKRILMERPNYPFAIAALADLAMTAGNLSEAEKLLHQATAIIPEVGYYIQLAELYKQQGRTGEMKKTEQEILVMLQDDVDSGHNMDMEYATLYHDHFEDPSRALEYMKPEYAARPDNIDVNRMLAAIYLDLGDTASARQHFQRASATDSKHPELLALRSSLETTSK